MASFKKLDCLLQIEMVVRPAAQKRLRGCSGSGGRREKTVCSARRRRLLLWDPLKFTSCNWSFVPFLFRGIQLVSVSSTSLMILMLYLYYSASRLPSDEPKHDEQLKTIGGAKETQKGIGYHYCSSWWLPSDAVSSLIDRRPQSKHTSQKFIRRVLWLYNYCCHRLD